MRTRIGGECSETDEAQRVADGPALKEIIVDGNVFVSRKPTDSADTPNNLIYCGIIHEVVESQSVRVLKLELVVIRQQAKQDERFQDLHTVIAVFDELSL